MDQSPTDNTGQAKNGLVAASLDPRDAIFDPRDAMFDTAHLKGDLKRSSTRGGMITMVGQGTRIMLTIGAQFILCRLVSPDDFGLFFMVTTITAFAEIFKEMGLSMAVIQKEKVTHREVTNVFWLNVLVGALMALMVAGASWPVSWFYNRPELIPITLSISITFLLAGCTAQHRAILNRKMNYKALTINELDSLVLGILAAIVVGILHKYGAATPTTPEAWWHVSNGWWALVMQMVVTGFAQAIGVWYLSPWRPSLPDKSVSIRAYVGFGANLTGFEILNYFARNVDKMLVGRVLGNDALGFYGNAYKLLLVPAWQINTPITRVAIPALSRLQNDPQKYRQYYVKSIGMLTFFGMPLVAAMTAMAEFAIPVMLGPQWTQCVPIFLALSPAAFSSTFNVATGWVHSSLGRPHRQFKWGIVSSISCVAGFFIAIFGSWSVTFPFTNHVIQSGTSEAVAWSFSLTYSLITLGPVAFIYCFQGTPLKPAMFVKAVYRQFVCAITAATVTHFMLTGLTHWFGDWYGTKLWIPFILGSATHGFLYLLMFWFMPHGRSFMLEIVSLVENFRKKKASPKDAAAEPEAPVTSPPVDPSAPDVDPRAVETTRA